MFFIWHCITILLCFIDWLFWTWIFLPLLLLVLFCCLPLSLSLSCGYSEVYVLWLLICYKKSWPLPPLILEIQKYVGVFIREQWYFDFTSLLSSLINLDFYIWCNTTSKFYFNVQGLPYTHYLFVCDKYKHKFYMLISSHLSKIWWIELLDTCAGAR